MTKERAITRLKEIIDSDESSKGFCMGLTDDELDEEIEMCKLSIEALEKQVIKKPMPKQTIDSYMTNEEAQKTIHDYLYNNNVTMTVPVWQALKQAEIALKFQRENE